MVSRKDWIRLSQQLKRTESKEEAAMILAELEQLDAEEKLNRPQTKHL